MNPKPKIDEHWDYGLREWPLTHDLSAPWHRIVEGIIRREDDVVAKSIN